MKLGTEELGNRKNATSYIIVHDPTSALQRAQRTKVSFPPRTAYCAAFGFLHRANHIFLTILNLLNDPLLNAYAAFLERLNTIKNLTTFCIQVDL